MMTTGLDLETLELLKGSHHSRDEGLCVMEAVAWFAGLGHTDRPSCTDSVVAAYARALNDRMPLEQRQRLKEFIPLLAGTSNGCQPQTRAFMAADRAVRVFAPMALRALGKNDWAEKLANLAPIIDRESALEAKKAAADTAAAYAAYAADAAAAAACRRLSREAAAAAYAAAAAASPVWDEAIQLLRDLIEAHEPDGASA